MTRPRVFHNQPLAPGETFRLGTKESRYLKQVLRLRPDAELVVASGSGEEFICRIENLAQRVAVRVMERVVVAEGPIEIILAQAVIKGEKMDSLLVKATELGVRRIIPYLSRRSVVKLKGEKTELKEARWRRLVREGARKVGRVYLPQVDPLVDFEGMLAAIPAHCLKIFFWEEEERLGLKDLLRQADAERADSFALVVGPEGGFDRQEAEAARRGGFILTTLGRQVLTVESAMAAAVAVIQYERGVLGRV